jgi:hypothetical protein
MFHRKTSRRQLYGAAAVVATATLAITLQRFPGHSHATKSLNPQKLGHDISTCMLEAVTYTSSMLEKAWLENVKDWQDHFCENTDQFRGDVAAWIAAVNSYSSSTRPTNLDESVFSYFEYKYICDGMLQTYKSWIEPLSHALRHPNALCHGANKFDRGYLLMASREDVDRERQLSCLGRACQSIMIDVGASTWNTGAGGASQSWFEQAYRKNGVKFDRYLMWEATPMSDSAIFKELPPELWHKYQYFNLPASSDITNAASPINALKHVAQPGDFVVFKLDIDNFAVESALVDRIANDPRILALIDEFVYEEHVNFAPMVKCCWGATANPNLTLHDSYRHFLQLRAKGIRAHSWV